MIHRSIRASVVLNALVFTLGCGIALGQIADPKCADKANKFAAKVSATQNKENRSCVKNQGKGKLQTTVEACLTADAKQKVQKKKNKVSSLFAAGGACEGNEATDLVTDATTINGAHVNSSIDLIHDIFGADLDAGQISQDKNDAKCQDKLAQRTGQVFDTWLKEFRKCKKAAMKDGATTAAEVITACLSAAPVRGFGSGLPDPKGKIEKKSSKLADDVAGKCQGLDLDALAPGACVGGGVQGDVGKCLDDLAECEACQAIKQADGLDIDCDLIDNDIIGTCPPTPVPAAECEILNAAECLLPYPSSHFLVADGGTATGLRVDLPASGMPSVNGPAYSPAPYNELDGFSPMVQAIMHFPQGVDLELSDTARLLEPGCCGQPAGPPWIDTRTYDSRSLDADSPSVLIRADTGEHILHWLEVDGRAQGAQIPGRQAVFLRAGQSLVPGKRYVIGIRHLKTADGHDVLPEGAFAALRDNVVTGIPAIESRRAQMDSDVFGPLVSAGVPRGDLILAYDFTVQSDSQLTRQMLSMRDQAFAWLDTVDLTPGLVTFSVAATTPVSNCLNGDDVVWKKVSGTFQSPLFLDGQPVQTGVQLLNVDGNDLPVQNGFMQAPFDISIPCSVFNGGIVSRPIVLGHGLFGQGTDMTDSIPDLKAQFADWTYIAGATDWIGLSSRRDDDTDYGWVGVYIIGLGSSQLNNFPAFADRLRQGMLNTLVLGKMMKLGLFNRDTAFEKSPGVGVFPGPGEDEYYYGISLGGIMGTWFSALTPDVDRFGLDVPGINFSCLLQRSTQFTAFDAVINSIGISDPMHFALFIGLSHELWVSAEPAGYATHITSDPLPGSGSAKRILMTPSWLDKQVSNQCTEAEARTLGLPNLTGSLQQGLQNIPDQAGPLDSAYVLYDTGAFDIFNPAHQPFIPPLSNIIPSGVCDPHSGPRRIPAAVQQLVEFLQPGGEVENFCNGTCDAGDPLEIPGGGICDVLSSNPGELCTSDGECGGGTCVATICDPLNP